MAGSDLLLHPVRLRIVQAFLGDRELTTAELGEELSDIPPASLYRHVARLADAGVLATVGERRVRGAVERTYALRLAAATVAGAGAAPMSRDDHRQAFTAFVAGLLADFDRYLERDEIDPEHDGVGYRMSALWLTDAELDELVNELTGVLAGRLGLARTPERRRRLLATLLLPGAPASV